MLELIVGDLEEKQSYAPNLNEKMTVFHLAADRNFIGSLPERVRRINVEATLELARRSLKAQVLKFVHVSTAIIFYSSNGECITENIGDHKGMVSHSYFQSRIEALERMKDLTASGLPLVPVCPTIVFGPDSPTHPNTVTNYLHRLLRSGGTKEEAWSMWTMS